VKRGGGRFQQEGTRKKKPKEKAKKEDSGSRVNAGNDDNKMEAKAEDGKVGSRP